MEIHGRIQTDQDQFPLGDSGGDTFEVTTFTLDVRHENGQAAFEPLRAVRTDVLDAWAAVELRA